MTTPSTAFGDTDQPLTVEFGPLEQRGILLGISAPSMVAISATVPLALLLLFTAGGTFGVLAAIVCLGVGLAFALVQVAGATAAEWAVILTGYLARAATGRTHWRSTSPTVGLALAPTLVPIGGAVGRARRSAPRSLAGSRHRGPVVDLPADLARAKTRVMEVEWGDSRAGIIIDGPLAIGVLRARSAGAFLMMEPGDQAAVTAHWAELIGSVADAGSPWVRLQWIDTTTPVDDGALTRFVADAMCPAARVPGTPQHTARASYERLLHRAAPATETHDVLIALAMDPRRVTRQVKDAGGGDRGLAKVCARGLEQVAYKLAGGDILVDGILSARQVGQVLRQHVDPSEHLYQSALTAGTESTSDADASPYDAAAGADAGFDPVSAWTLAGDESFGTHRTDGAVHTTLWVKEWPRRPSRVDFLAPLLLRTGSITRSISVVMAPVDATSAMRAAEGAATADESDNVLRERFGMRTSSRRRRENEMAHRREEELVDGYDDVRFSAYITVTAPTTAALEEAVADVHAQARAARLRLLRLAGQQAEALWYTAPLCRGVR